MVVYVSILHTLRITYVHLQCTVVSYIYIYIIYAGALVSIYPQHNHNVHNTPRCLEHFPSFYASSNSRCKEAWTLDYEADHSKVGDTCCSPWVVLYLSSYTTTHAPHGQPLHVQPQYIIQARVEDEKKTIYDDLANFANSHMYDHFDVIVATQVLDVGDKGGCLRDVCSAHMTAYGIAHGEAHSMCRCAHTGRYANTHIYTCMHTHSPQTLISPHLTTPTAPHHIIPTPRPTIPPHRFSSCHPTPIVLRIHGTSC